MLKSGRLPAELHAKSMTGPLVGSEKIRTFAPELQNTIIMRDFFQDLKQSAPWWLMLLLQVIEAILQALTSNPT